MCFYTPTEDLKEKIYHRRFRIASPQVPLTHRSVGILSDASAPVVTAGVRVAVSAADGAFFSPPGGSEGTEYELATHSVRVRRTGTLLDINALWDMEGRFC